MPYLNALQLPPDTGAGLPGAPPALPDPNPTTTTTVTIVSLEDQVDILGADIVLGRGGYIRCDVDPHLAYKTLCLLSTAARHRRVVGSVEEDSVGACHSRARLDQQSRERWLHHAEFD